MNAEHDTVTDNELPERILPPFDEQVEVILEACFTRLAKEPVTGTADAEFDALIYGLVGVLYDVVQDCEAGLAVAIPSSRLRELSSTLQRYISAEERANGPLVHNDLTGL